MGNWRRHRPELVAGGAAGVGATLVKPLLLQHLPFCPTVELLLFWCEPQQAGGTHFPATPGHDRAASEGPWKWAPTCGLTLWLHTVVLWLSRANTACDSAALNGAPMASILQPACSFRPPLHCLILIFDDPPDKCLLRLN